MPSRLKTLASFAHTFGLEVLLEVHNEEELEGSLDVGADLIGVNNRDLKKFQLSIEVSKRLANRIPNLVKASESGIESVQAILELKTYGYKGFLMGKNFMQHSRPEVACKEFIDDLKKDKSESGSERQKRYSD